MKALIISPYKIIFDTKVYPEMADEEPKSEVYLDKALASVFGEGGHQSFYLIGQPLTDLKFKYMNENEKLELIESNKLSLYTKIEEYKPDVIIIDFKETSYGGIFASLIKELKENSKIPKLIHIYHPKYAKAKRLASMKLSEYVEHIKSRLNAEEIKLSDAGKIADS